MQDAAVSNPHNNSTKQILTTPQSGRETESQRDDLTSCSQTKLEMNKVEFQSWVKATVRPVIFLGNAVCVDPSYFLCIFSGKESKEKKSEE